MRNSYRTPAQAATPSQRRFTRPCGDPSPSAPTFLEKAFVVTVLLMAMGAFLNLGTRNLADTADVSGGTPALQITWAILSLISVWLLFRCRGWFSILLREGWVLSLSVLIAMSLFWSEAPGISFRRLAVFSATIAFALYYSLRFPLRDQLRLVAVSLGIAAVSSVPFSLLGIGTPTEVFHGAWNGVFLHKNALGHHMALSFLVFAIAGRDGAIPRYVGYGGAFLSVLLVLLSRSATSLALLGLMGIVVIVGRTSLVRYPLRLAIGFVLLLVLGWSVFIGLEQYGEVLHALGKDSSFSGRTEVWSASWNEAMRRPALGYGYNAFWLGKDGPSRYVWKELHWSVPHAHNGYIDLVLQVGLVGLALFGIAIIAQLRGSMVMLRVHDSHAALWPFAFLCFFLLSNITESDLLRPHSLSLVLYVSSAFVVSRALQRLKAVAPSHTRAAARRVERVPA